MCSVFISKTTRKDTEQYNNFYTHERRIFLYTLGQILVTSYPLWIAFRKYSKLVQMYFSLPLLLTRNFKPFNGGYSLKKYNC